jgi:hypothetical protein
VNFGLALLLYLNKILDLSIDRKSPSPPPPPPRRERDGDHSPLPATPVPASNLNPHTLPFVLGEGSSSRPSG